MPKPYYTLRYQFQLAENALHEARNLVKAKYYTSAISQAYQVAHRCAAALLFGIEASVHTEKDVGIGFEAAFVSSQRSEPRFAHAYRRLAAMRQKADFDHDFVAGPEEGAEALRLAEEFRIEAERLAAALGTGPA